MKIINEYKNRFIIRLKTSIWGTFKDGRWEEKKFKTLGEVEEFLGSEENIQIDDSKIEPEIRGVGAFFGGRHSTIGYIQWIRYFEDDDGIYKMTWQDANGEHTISSEMTYKDYLIKYDEWIND